MTSSTKNVKLGVCRVYFDSQDLGLTQGGVEVQVTTSTHKTEVDQFGKTPINEFIEGRTCNVKVPMAETTLRNLVNIMPGATLVTDGVQASGTLTFTAQPSANATVTVAGQAFTFKTTNPTSIYEVKIGATLADTLQNLAAAINLSPLQVAAGGVLASSTATVTTVKCGDPGTAGNAFTLAAGGTSNATASGANFTGGVAETRARVDVVVGTGTDMLAIAKQLRLHPVAKADTDYSDDFVVHKTATPGALQFAYKLDAERVFNVEFMAYPDPVTQKLFSVGDPLAV
jgi:hypothetical protein